MLSPSLRRTTLACTLVVLLSGTGCDKIHSMAASHGTPGKGAGGSSSSSNAGGGSYYDKLQPIVASHQVQVLHYPDFADYAAPVQTFYEGRSYETAWVSSNHPHDAGGGVYQGLPDGRSEGAEP